MDFEYSAEQEMLRAAAHDWCQKRFPFDRVARLADSADIGAEAASAFDEMNELGWIDAALAGVTEAAILLEECAYVLAPTPFFVSVALAAPFGADPRVPTTLAWAEPGRLSLGDQNRTTVDSRGRVTGCKTLVPDLAITTHAVVTAQGSRPRLVQISDADMVPRPSLDGTRRLGDLILDGAPSEELPTVELNHARSRVLALAAAECLGIAQKVFDQAVEHARAREQFGRPIGSYQAISHRLANIYTKTQLARSLVAWACWAIDADDPNSLLAALAAKAEAGGAAIAACEGAIQVHGGIGFTWESSLHRYYKRAQWLSALDGGPARQRAAIADAVLKP